MMQVRCFLFSLLLLVAVAADALAQDDLRSLSLTEAIALAVHNNETIGIADAGYEAADAGVWQAYGAMMPSLNAYGQFTRNLTKPTMDNEMYLPLTPLFMAHEYPPIGTIEQDLVYDNEWVFGARLEQPLFTSGRIYNALCLAKAYRQMADIDRGKQEKDVREKTEEAYLAALLTRETLTIYRQALDQTIKRRDDIKSKRDRGLASDYELMFAETEVAKRQSPLISAENNYENALRALKMQIGLPQEATVELTDALHLEPLVLERQQAIDEALGNRDELNLLSAQIDARKSEANLYLSNMLPTVGAFGEVDLTTQLNDDFWPQEEDDEFKQFTTIGIGVNWPLFDGLQNYQKRRQSRAKQRADELTRQQARRGIELEVNTCFNNLTTKREEVAAHRQTVQLAERTYQLAEIRYQSGLATQLELNDAQLNVTSTKTELAASVYGYALARAQLLRALGR
ncbi:MAG TPA: TolC family protein [bacterium]|nr:TolC family protein [bacterium]